MVLRRPVDNWADGVDGTRDTGRVSHRQPLPSDLTDTPFSTTDALTRGVPPSRLRARDLEAPFHGIRRRQEPPAATSDHPTVVAERRHAQLLSDCRAFLQREGRPIIFSHVTAARLYRLPLPWQLDSRRRIDVAALTPDHAPQGDGVVGHRLVRELVSVQHLNGLLVPSPIDVWIQLAALLSTDQLVEVGDALVRRKAPLATLSDLRNCIDRTRRRRGARRLRDSVRWVRPGTDSPAETRMRLILVRGGLPEPVVGHTVYDSDGYFVGTPDLSYVRERIALDYEGEIHRVDEETFASDIERREMFQDAEWRHIRVVKEHLRNPSWLVDRVGFALAHR